MVVVAVRETEFWRRVSLIDVADRRRRRGVEAAGAGATFISYGSAPAVVRAVRLAELLRRVRGPRL